MLYFMIVVVLLLIGGRRKELIPGIPSLAPCPITRSYGRD